MTANEKGPGAGGNQSEAEIPTTPSQEHEVNENIIAETQGAGESLAEWNARDRAEKSAWLAAHPEALAAKPEWATQVGVEWEFENRIVTITYEREFGHVLLSRWATWEHGAIRFTDGTTTPEVVVLLRDDPLTIAQMRELAGNLLAATPIVETALVTP
ncbi:hypothetical protein AB0N61_10355 [Microbacterium sp. NPDC089320]|uniref:hypothetical protein n=1 Tax=Microbacterium sp. NPDC089320 TaxID=3155182 RepID=UPI00342B862A